MRSFRHSPNTNFNVNRDIIVIHRIRATNNQSNIRLVVKRLHTRHPPQDPTNAMRPVTKVERTMGFRSNTRTPFIRKQVINRRQRTLGTQNSLFPRHFRVKHFNHVIVNRTISNHNRTTMGVKSQTSRTMGQVNRLTTTCSRRTRQTSTHTLTINHFRVCHYGVFRVTFQSLSPPRV